MRLIRDALGCLIRALHRPMFPTDQLSPLRLAAHHEAGHAVAAVALGIGLERVSVVDDRDTLGRIVLDQGWPHLRPGFDPGDLEHRREAEGYLLLALAGECAEACHSGREPGPRDPGAEWDLRVATAIAERLCGGTSHDAFLEEMRGRARRLVSDPLRRRQIAAVARRLVEVGELSRRQVVQIMDEVAKANETGAPG